MFPADYHGRWLSLARYGVEFRHGAACKYSLMYALTLRRSGTAADSHVKKISARIWEAEGARKHLSEHVSLFEDSLIHKLLETIELTADFPTPAFPTTPCGSNRTDIWRHSCIAQEIPRRDKFPRVIRPLRSVCGRSVGAEPDIFDVGICVTNTL